MATTYSQPIQESEARVGRAVAAGFAVQWLGAGQSSLFEREVGVDVHLRGFDFSTVTETELDAVADELNERPRKRFDFATPTEQLSELLLR